MAFQIVSPRPNDDVHAQGAPDNYYVIVVLDVATVDLIAVQEEIAVGPRNPQRAWFRYTTVLEDADGEPIKSKVLTRRSQRELRNYSYQVPVQEDSFNEDMLLTVKKDLPVESIVFHLLPPAN